MKTGVVCMDPETQWKRGMFEGKISVMKTENC
jgi:hypothetical protein